MFLSSSLFVVVLLIMMMNINKSNGQIFCEIGNEIKLVNDTSSCLNNKINQGKGWNSSIFSILIYRNRDDNDNNNITIDYGNHYQNYYFNITIINKPIINQIEIKS